MTSDSTRRQFLGGVATIPLVPLRNSSLNANQPATDQPPPFRFCLNTSTIRGDNLTLVQKIAIAQRAGYTGIEPWIREIEEYTQGGGTLRDLRQRLADAGLRVESAIGFAEWIVDDDNRRRAGLERARRDMDMVRQVGGSRIAAPPAGATRDAITLENAAERYGALCAVGERMDVVPQLEVWGFSRTLSRLGQCLYTATECNQRNAALLLDVYHLYKGGSDFNGLRLLNGQAMHVFHMNDYPVRPPRNEIGDADRVYPGDGVAPLTQILRDLRQSGFRGVLSLELFNRTYWQQDPATVARTGLEKMQAAVRRSLEA